MKTFADVQEQRELLEKRICDVTAELQSLKQAYNLLSVPNQLPVEILSDIFAFCAADVTRQFKSTDRRSFSWIKVTAHVCHHWREVALNCTELWSTLLFIDEELAELMLARSKSAPLSVEVFITHGWQQYFSPRLTSQVHRWQRIELQGHVQWVDLTSPAPILQKLVIRPFGFISMSTSPDVFFHGHAPLLKHLELENLGISNYKMLPLSAPLTYLELEEDRERQIQPYGQGLLDALQQLPLLETLVLTDCIPSDLGDNRTSTTSYRVNCPSLRTLSLSGYTECVQGLLDSLHIHEEASVAFSLIFTGSSGNIHILERFFASLASAWTTSIGVHELAVNDTTALYPLPQYIFYSNLRNAPSDMPKLNIAFRSLDDDLLLPLEASLQAPFLLTSAKAIARLDDLQVFSMKSEHDLTEDGWREMLGHLPELREITFNASNLDIFLRVLNHAPTLADPGNGQDDTPHFASLRKITIKRMAFWNPDVKGDFGSIFMDALKSRPDTSRLAFLHVLDDSDHSLWKAWHEPSGMSLWNAIRKNFPDLSISWQEYVGGSSDGSHP